MPAARSRANVVWEGDLAKGKGNLNVESGILTNQEITWAARTQRVKGTTSPEELLAAAHAGCYAMAFSSTLAKAGTPPTRLLVDATATFEVTEAGARITAMELEVHGVVPGLDQARFEELARQGEQGCPVSNALRNNVQISVKAHLE
jgi:osmotically inducible protein OsmC